MRFDLFSEIKVYYSEFIARGEMLVFGSFKKPENWKSMTRDEQIEWAIIHGGSVMINPLDNLRASKN